jgi:hypothetical protein
VSIDTELQPHDVMDDHPIDLLRLYVAAGAVEGLKGLSSARRNEYVADIEAVAKLVAGGATEVGLRGSVKIDQKIDVDTNMKLSDAAEAARKVGKMLATEKFAKLNNHCIQDIETWDDADEAIAQDVCSRVLAGKSIVAAGDDAQLLAGVTLALLQNPDLYDAATKLLNDALDDSFDRDPIWGVTLRGHAVMAVEGWAKGKVGKAKKKAVGKKR